MARNIPYELFQAVYRAHELIFEARLTDEEREKIKIDHQIIGEYMAERERAMSPEDFEGYKRGLQKVAEAEERERPEKTLERVAEVLDKYAEDCNSQAIFMLHHLYMTFPELDQ